MITIHLAHVYVKVCVNKFEKVNVGGTFLEFFLGGGEVKADSSIHRKEKSLMLTGKKKALLRASEDGI